MDDSIDISQYANGDGTYSLPSGLNIDGVDLIDSQSGRRIWSVGEDADGRRTAALDERFYHASGFTCVWCR